MGRGRAASASARTSRSPASAPAPRRPDSPAATSPTTSTRNTTTGSIGPGSSTGAPARTSIPRSASSRTRAATAACSSAYHETMRQQKIRDWGFREWQPHVQLHALRVSRWRAAGRGAASRQSLGLGERLPHRHRAPGHVGRVPRAVRDLSRRHRPGRRARRSALPDEREHGSPEVDLVAAAMGRRHVPDRHAEQPHASDLLIRAGRAVHGGHDLERIERSRCRRARSTPTWATCA